MALAIVYIGRHRTTPDTGYGQVANDQSRGQIFSPTSQALWVEEFGAWIGHLGGSGAVRVGLYRVASSKLNDRIGYSVLISATTLMTEWSGGNDETGGVAVWDEGEYHVLFPNTPVGLALLAGAGGIGHSMIAAGDVVGYDERFFDDMNAGDLPIDPFDQSIVGEIEGVMAVWVKTRVNEKPRVPVNRSPSGQISDLTPTFVSTFRDRNGRWGTANDGTNTGDELQRVQILLKNRTTGATIWNHTYNATEAEKNADEASKTYPSSGVPSLAYGGLYSWQTRHMDQANEWGDYADPLNFDIASVGQIVGTGPSDKQETQSPTFAGTWTHAGGLAMETVRVRLKQGSLIVDQSGDIAKAAVNGAGFVVSMGEAGFTALDWGEPFTVEFQGEDSDDVWMGAWSTPLAFSTDAAPTIPSNVTPSGTVHTVPPVLKAAWTDSDDTTATGLTGVFEVTRPGYDRLHDDFERADTSPGSLGDALTGQAWNLHGAGSDTAKIASGRYVSGAVGTGENVYAWVQMDDLVTEVRCKVSWLAGANPQPFAPVISRWPPPTDVIGDFIHPVILPTGVNLELWQDGSLLVLLNAYPLSLAKDGTIYEFRYRVWGNDIDLWLPGSVAPQRSTHAKVSEVHGDVVWFQIADQAGMNSVGRYEEIEAIAGIARVVPTYNAASGLWERDTAIAVDEVQRVAITGGPTGGSFFLGFDGEFTAALDWDATASEVDTALEGSPRIGAGDVIVTGGPLPGTPVDVEFTNELAGMNLRLMEFTNFLTGGTVPTPVISTLTEGIRSAIQEFGEYELAAYSGDGTLYSGVVTDQLLAVRSSLVSFTYAEGPTVTITSPAHAGTFETSAPLVTWTASEQAQKRVEVIEVATGIVEHDSTYLISTDEEYQVPGGIITGDGTEWSFRVSVKDDLGLVGQDTNTATLDYVPEDAVEEFTVVAHTILGDPYATTVRMTWTPPGVVDSEFIGFRIYRSDTPGEHVFLTGPATDVYLDYFPPSHQDLTYTIVQVVDRDGDELEGLPATGEVRIELSGFVIHAVDNPASERLVSQVWREIRDTSDGRETRIVRWSGGAPRRWRRPGTWWHGFIDFQINDVVQVSGRDAILTIRILEERGGPLIFRDRYETRTMAIERGGVEINRRHAENAFDVRMLLEQEDV